MVVGGLANTVSPKSSSFARIRAGANSFVVCGPLASAARRSPKAPRA
jgi:hypothetical protein